MSWDLFVLVAFATLVIYSVYWGRNKIVGLMVNFYISLAVTLAAGGFLYELANNLEFISTRLAAPESGIKLGLMVVLITALSIKSEIAGLDSAGTVSRVSAGIYGFLFTGLALSGAFHLMSETERLALDSNFVNIVSQYFAIWVLAGVAYMIGSSFFRK